MADEKEPLLTEQDPENTGSGSSNSSVSLNMTSFRVPRYGSTSPPLTKVVTPEDRLTYTWNELNAFVNVSLTNKPFFSKSSAKAGEKKQILKNVCGVALPGELLAILGSSGAGKTTLLNALTFRQSGNVAVSGVRSVNGTPVSSKSLISRSAYVQQDDLFIGNLTVKEHLIFQALVRMDRHITYSQRMKRVDEVISELALTKCQHTQVGIIGRIKGISGGERKRLAFAAEVLTNPRLMFCDEPTSGLDSFMALNVVQVLKNMASNGKTIICTIHQPSSELYAMFDKLLLMTEGRTAFLGSPEEAGVFFKQLEAPCPRNYNPADYFIQLLAIVPERERSCREAVALICDKYERSELGVKVALEAANTANGFNDIWLGNEVYHSPYKAGWCAQFRAVLWRSWLTVIKEPLLIKVRFLQTAFISLIVGAIYYGQELNQNGVMNINGVLFLFLTNMTFQNVFAVVNVFCSEMQIFLRENRNGMYRTDVYFLCKTLAELPIFIILPIFFTAICYFLIGLNSTGAHFYIACGIVALVSNVATSFGYLISCSATNVSMALSVGPPVIIPFLLFGGFFLNINSIPVYFKWLSYLSWFRFGNEALMINQWNNIEEITCVGSNATCPRNGHVVLEIYNFSEGNFTLDLAWLVGLIVGFRILAYLALLFKTYRYK